MRVITQCVAVLVGTVLLGGCSDSPLGGGGPPLIISATWVDVDDAGHTIFFRSVDDGETSGTLAGREDHPELGTFDSPVGGFWEGGRIEMVIVRGGEAYKFVATIDGPEPTELVFTSVGGTADGFTIEQPQ